MNLILINNTFTYADGKLFWKNNRANNRVKSGDEAGCIDVHGYKVVNIDYKLYKVHRIIFLMHNGYLPEFVDHKDNDTINNYPSNLRECSHHDNCKNSVIGINNTTGVKGLVHYPHKPSPWTAQLWSNGKYVLQKAFKEKQDAIDAIKIAREKYHGEFARHA